MQDTVGTVSTSPGYHGEDHPLTKCSGGKFQGSNMPSMISSHNVNAHLHELGFLNSKSKSLWWEVVERQIW